MFEYSVSSAPAVEPITLAEAKHYARISDSDTEQDDFIEDVLIPGVRGAIEKHLGRALITQTRIAMSHSWDAMRSKLLYGPIQSVSSVEYIANGGSSYSTLSSSAYIVSTSATKISLASGYSWPSLADHPDAVKVTFVCGFGNASTNVPAEILIALRIMIRDYFDNRGTISNGRPVFKVPDLVDMLLEAYKERRF